MEQIKTALTALEQAVLRLESAVHTSKKNQTQANDRIVELKQALKTVHDRLDKAITSYHRGGE